MYENPKCECGKELVFETDDFFGGDDDIVLYQSYGHCPKCKKRYRWKNVYALTDFSDLEEIE